MKGMFTKQYTPDGKVFYYNSSLKVSVWSPPSDAVVHEAENAKPLPADDTEESKEPIHNQHYQQQQKQQRYQDNIWNADQTLPSRQQSDAMIKAAALYANAQAEQHANMINMQLAHDTRSTQDMINDAVAKKQQELLAAKKRKAGEAGLMESSSSNSSDSVVKVHSSYSSTNQSNGRDAPSSASSNNNYLKQKSEYESMGGSKGDDEAGKWLVR